MRYFYLIYLLVLPWMLLGQRPELVVPIGHTSYINSAVFSPDGQAVLTGAWDNTVRLWDVKGNELKSFEFTDKIFSANFSPDGNIILASSYATAQLWDLAGNVLQSFEHNGEEVTASFSPDGQTVLTCNQGNTIQIRNLDNQLLQLFQHQDKISDAVFAPDGQTVLTGSWDNTAKLWDLAGNELQSFQHRGWVESVAFSPDGEYILTSSRDSTARLWDRAGNVLQAFNYYDELRSAKFSPDGQTILTESWDNTTQRWSLVGNELDPFPKLDQVRTTSFSPDGLSILVVDINNNTQLQDLQGKPKAFFRGHSQKVDKMVLASDDQKVVMVYGSTLKQMDLSGKPLNYLQGKQKIRSVAIAPDGKSILTGIYGMANRWDFTGKELNGFPHNSFVSSVNYSLDGQTLLSVSLDDHAKLWNLEGELLQDFKYDFGNTSTSFSPDGQQVVIGARNGQAKVWNLKGKAEKTLAHDKAVRSVDFSPDGNLILTSTEDQTVKLWTASGNLEATLNFPTDIRSVAFTPDSLSFFVNAIGALVFYDLSGKQLQIIKHQSSLNSVALTSDAQTIITAGEDHTLRFWNRKTGKEIIRYINIDEQDWIAVTPEGLFDASPGAMNLMHYIVYYKDTYEVIELEQLKARYYEPGLLPKVLGYSDERIRPIQDFNSIALYPKIEASIKEDVLYINLKERNGGIGKVSIFINGKEVVEEANPISVRGDNKRGTAITSNLNQFKNYLLRHPDSTNVISLRAYNEAGWLKSSSFDLDYRPTYQKTRGKNKNELSKNWEASLDPKLYVVSIGTSNYTGTSLDLKYADQDATMMANALASVGNSLFSSGDSLEVYCLSTSTADSVALAKNEIQWQFANKANIKQTFAAIKAAAKAEDIVAVYLSGHGVTQGGSDQTQFYYLTQGVASEEDLEDPMTRNAYTISSEELTKWINDIPALKQVLVIDACNSGQVVENLTGSSKSLNSSQIRALDRMKDRTGMFVLSGSASNKVSYEASEYGQGLLTYALLQGMLGLATRKDTEGKEIVDVMKLFQYARDQVPELAASIQGIQTPMLGFPSQGASFDIGILDNKAKKNIQLGNKKPVVIRSIFQNQESFGDDLNLVGMIEQAFRKESNKGKNADLIFVDVNNYPGAYALRGLYEVDKGNITLKLKIFQDEKAIHDLPVIKTDKPERISKILMRSLKKFLDGEDKVEP